MLDFELAKEFVTIESLIAEDDWQIFYNNRDIVRSQYYNFYYSYSNSWKPSSILEIGVRRGYSAVSMAIGAGNSLLKFVGIDSEIDLPSSSSFAKEILQAHTSAEIKLININTQKDDISDNIGIFDLIHIDADHTFYGCINDILLALSLSQPGTRIIVDDCLYTPVRAAVETIAKIYHDNLEIKYVNNFRGHGLIETSGSFPELANKQTRDKIVNQQESPFPRIQFSSIADSYSVIRMQVEQYHIQNNNLPNEVLNSIDQIIDKVDLYLKEAVQQINLALRFYQNSGFDLGDTISVVNSIASELITLNTKTSYGWKKTLFGTDKSEPEDVKICKKIYSRLYLLEQFRLKLSTNSVGKCFSFFYKESEKHFEYLTARISKDHNSSHLTAYLPGLDNYKNNFTKNFITHEGHLFITVLTDALINVGSCFESELESQYWMRSWEIKGNQTWNKLIIPTVIWSNSPTPFPVKSQVEYDDFYKLQHAGNAGGIKAKDNNQEQLSNHSIKSDYSQPTDHLFRTFTTISHIKLILELLKERYPGETIKWLDVGCGIGFISNRVKFDGIVVGIDVAESLVEYANATRLTENHKYITGNFSDARNIVGGEKFHLITANEVVEHIFDPLGFICELSEHTRDMIFASSPLSEAVPYRPTPEHLWSFTLESYSSLFEAAGMKITFSGTLQVGKYIGECHNWLAVGATINQPFRVLPLSK